MRSRINGEEKRHEEKLDQMMSSGFQQNKHDGKDWLHQGHLLAFGSYIWGYNIGVLASVLAHPGFQKPSTGQMLSGTITAI